MLSKLINDKNKDIIQLNQFYQDIITKLNVNEYNEIYFICSKAIDLCKVLKDYFKNNNEIMANFSFICEKFFAFFQNYSELWKYFYNKEFRKSWDFLQDSINLLHTLLDFTEKRNWTKFYLEDFLFILMNFEKLYPYKIFSSVEFAVKKEKCNICNNSPFDPKCTHVPGRLYNGEMAYLIVEDANLTGISLVQNPLDKKCVIELSDNEIPFNERYKILLYFLTLKPKVINKFHVEESIRFVKQTKYENIGRNDKCPCGSNLKFKKCCGKDIKGIYLTIVNDGLINF